LVTIVSPLFYLPTHAR